MNLIHHHIYEYKKGVRNLILHTTKQEDEQQIRDKLVHWGIAFVIFDIGHGKINVFFGDAGCVAVVREIGKRNLGDYTDEEDFILGALLGYDLVGQCERFMQRKRHAGRKQQSAA